MIQVGISISLEIELRGLGLKNLEIVVSDPRLIFWKFWDLLNLL